jgi:hypothetical protein
VVTGVGFQADAGQAALDQVGRYWIFFSRAKKQADQGSKHQPPGADGGIGAARSAACGQEGDAGPRVPANAGSCVSHQPFSLAAGGDGKWQAELAAWRVGRRRRTCGGKNAAAGSKAIPRLIVVPGQAGKGRTLVRLLAASVAHNPVPAGRDGIKCAHRAAGPIEHVDAHRVDVIYVGAQRGQLGRGIGIQRQPDAQTGIGTVVAMAIMERLDGMADRVAIDEVDQYRPAFAH